MKLVIFVAALMIVFFLIASIFGIGYLKIHKDTYYIIASAILILYLIPLRKKDKYNYIAELDMNLKPESQKELLEIAKSIKDKTYSPTLAIPRIIVTLFAVAVLFSVINYLLLPIIK